MERQLIAGELERGLHRETSGKGVIHHHTSDYERKTIPGAMFEPVMNLDNFLQKIKNIGYHILRIEHKHKTHYV